MEYPFNKIEKKWQDIWHEKRVFRAENTGDKPTFYVLSMFPYPSGALHMGHVSNYSIGDAITRYKLMQGYNVMQPMGYDAFGMPAENFAIQHKSHPKITTESNIEIMRGQFDSIGFGFDWDREVSTCRPEYYRWGQWFFKRLYERGLAYKKRSFVNWCDACQTVLANEQVEDGNCWRCGSEVNQKELEQWFFRITDYAEELLDFSGMIDWPERVITMQKNWIGKSEGTRIDFRLEEDGELLPVFTTRPDTIFGCTFMAIPPEHPLVGKWLEKAETSTEIRAFCHEVMNEDKIMRTAEDTTKKGIFSGKNCINPVNGDSVQIWITNYVLMDYGTGAVMAVPAHDQRDFDFAGKYNIPMKIVIQNEDKCLVLEEMKEAYIEPGILVNSQQFDGMQSEESKIKISRWMQENKMGESTVTYRLRDWGISRQRYWGNPIPVIYCEKCGEVLVPDSELPVELPEDVELGKTRRNPLLSVDNWVNTTCPVCGGEARRETDTMDTFVDSSWYYARYTDARNDKEPFSKEAADKWLPVDQYIGGIEHACMHLLYARFFHKFMRDIGMVSCNEPFARLLTQGMVTKDGAKMSKSRRNVVDPQYIIDRFGSDTVRLFMLFSSPPEKDVEWSDDGVKGSFRFLNRVWRLIEDNLALINEASISYLEEDLGDAARKLRFSTHHAVWKVLHDIEDRLQYNTAIAAIMEHLNNIYAMGDATKLNKSEQCVYAEACRKIPQMLYFFAPHISEELWNSMGNTGLVHEYGLPTFEKRYLLLDEVTYAVQIMGRVRGSFKVSDTAGEEEIRQAALEVENVQKYLQGKNISKIIVVPGKLVSIVAK
jgi:leucyl-tRNA synthetase